MKIKNALPSQQITGDQDFDEILQCCVKTLRIKGDDYTVGNAEADRLHNFKTVANFTGLSPKEALGVYFYKHVAAIFAYIKKDGQAESEPIEGRIVDVINYMLLFAKLIREEKAAKKLETTLFPGGVR